MPQTVEIPDHGIAEFPDDMTPDQIKGVIQSKFYASPTPDATPQAGEVAPPVIQDQGSSGPTIEEQRAMLDKVSEGVKAPLEAAAETVGSFIPKSLPEVAQLATSLTPYGPVAQSLRAAKSISEGRPLEALSGIPVAQRIPEIQTAEQTPAFSKERYKAGFGTLADLLMVGGIGSMARGGAPSVPRIEGATTVPPLTETLFGKEKSPLVDAVNEGLTEAERYGTQPEVLGKPEPVAPDLPTGTGEPFRPIELRTPTEPVGTSMAGEPIHAPEVHGVIWREPSGMYRLSTGDEFAVRQHQDFDTLPEAQSAAESVGLTHPDKGWFTSEKLPLTQQQEGKIEGVQPEATTTIGKTGARGSTQQEGIGTTGGELLPQGRKVGKGGAEQPTISEVATPVSEAPVSTTATPLTQTERGISGNKTPVAQTGEAGTDVGVGPNATVSDGIAAIEKAVEPWRAHSDKTDALRANLGYALRKYGNGPLDDATIGKINNAISDLPRYMTGEASGKPPSVSVERQAPPKLGTLANRYTRLGGTEARIVEDLFDRTNPDREAAIAQEHDLNTVTKAQADKAAKEVYDFTQWHLNNVRKLPDVVTVYRAGPLTHDVVGVTLDRNVATRRGARQGDPAIAYQVPRSAILADIEALRPDAFAEKELLVHPEDLKPYETTQTQPNAVPTVPTGETQPAITTPETQVSTTAKTSQEIPESVTPETPPISTKNAYTESQRAIRGLPEAEQAAKRGFGKVWDEAGSEAEKDPTIGRRLVSEINAKPRPISDVENAHLLRREIEAQKEHSDAVDAVNTATNDSDLTAAKARLEVARNELQDVYDATKSAGTKGGQALAARQMLAKEDYSLAKMEARRRAANDGKPLNEQQLAETKALNEKITDLQSKLDAHEVAATFDREFSKLVDQSRKEAKASKATGTRFTDFMDRKADEARARITERRGQLTTGFDPTAITDEAIIGASHIAKGITKFADWSVEMAKEFGDQIRPFLKDLWERSKAFHDANAKEYGDKALARYKTYLGKQTEQVKGKLEAGDFTKAQRQKTQLDKEAFNMRADLQKLKNQFERGVAKEAYKNKTPAQKFWDHFVGVERAMKLSGPEVFGKLGVAAAVREALAPIESGVGFGVSKVFPKLAKGTKYEADLGTLVRGELKAKAALFTEGMKDAWQNVKGQETGLDAIGKQKIRPDFWYNRIGQMHAAIKAPVKRAEFTRDLTQRMAVAIKNGEDINHPEVMTRLANESVMEANRAIFQNKTVVSNFFSTLDRTSPAAGRAARFLFPVVKIPVNLFKELVNLHVGAPVGAARVGMAYWKGVETLPPVQREAIIRQLTKGSIGGAGLLWGYYNSDKVRNFFDHVPTWFNHTPMAMILNEGSYLKKLSQGKEQAKEGKKELAYMAKTDIPFMYTIKDIGDALDTHNSHALLGWINNMTQSTVVPQISTQVAKQMDKPGTFPSNLGEKPTYRPATNPIDAVKLGIPGLRQTIPVKEKKHTGVSRRR